MWATEASAITNASAATIWRYYVNVNHWTQWDDGIIASHLEGPFETGSEGALQTHDGKTFAFTLTAVEPERNFQDRTTMPDGTTLDFYHDLEPQTVGTRITQRIVIAGPHADAVATALSETLQHGARKAVQSLAQLAEVQA